MTAMGLLSPRWFDLPVFLRKDGSTVRRRMEMRARQRLAADIRARGWEPIPGSFKCGWPSPLEGQASMLGLPRKVEGRASGE